MVASVVHSPPSLPGLGMGARRIAGVVDQPRQHCGHHLRSNRRAGRMIQIDLLLKNLVSRLYSHGTKARADPVQGSLLEPGKAPTRLSAMEGYGSETYGETMAEVYDEWYGSDGGIALSQIGSPDEVADQVATLAGPAGTVLELGVGTGRLALPLADRGLAVTGLDASPSMLARIRAKPGSDRLTLVAGDMAEPTVAGTGFDVVLVGFNTFFNLATEAAQQTCLHGVAATLAPEGRFVLEAFVPEPDAHDGVSVREVSVDRVMLDVVAIDRTAQTITGQRIVMTAAGNRFFPYLLRYATPDQLDAMAGDAGLERVDRTEDWRGTPFSNNSSYHVSTRCRADAT